MAFSGMTVTTLGKALQAKVDTGETLTFTKMAIGDGTTTLADFSSLTALVDQKMTIGLDSIKVIDTVTCRIRGTLTNSGVTTGFYEREIGLFASDPDAGEILFAYDNAGDECDYLQAYSKACQVDQVLDILIGVSSSESVSVTLTDSAVFCSAATTIDHPDSSVTTAKIADSAVADAKIGMREIDDTVEAAVGFGVLTNLLTWND
jgi:hypothetical protein